MFALLSPAKKLDFTRHLDDPSGGVLGWATPESAAQSEKNPAPSLPLSLPDFLDDSQILITALRKMSPSRLSTWMKLSPKLADLNFARYRDYATPFTIDNAVPAAYAFRGDTYVGLDADTFDYDDMIYAQDHLRILSGLYGLLRPLDLIAPYRLEMGTRLATTCGANLYDFWGDKPTQTLNARITKGGDAAVINLASNEYIKVIDETGLCVPMITPVFREVGDKGARVIGLMAKRARGMMARHMIQNRLGDPQALKEFNAGGYEYDAAESTATRWIFDRET